jgi:two-component system OmpR family response regulator
MSPPEGAPVSVLIADDDTLVRTVLRLALTQAGYDVTEAANAVEAVAFARSHRPDLLVLDINMPGGLVGDTLSAVRAGDPDLPVLLLSGESGPPAELTGATVEFARKPISLDELLTRVSALLRTTREVSR